MSEREKFLFDLQGFLHVKDFLSAEEVRALNQAIDANVDEEAEGFFSDGAPYGGGMDGQFSKGTADGMLTWEQPWCQPFRDMLGHPKLIPYLNTLFGRGWRLDHLPFVSFAKKGTGGHGGSALVYPGQEPAPRRRRKKQEMAKARGNNGQS